jgi:hypothetical protein
MAQQQGLGCRRLTGPSDTTINAATRCDGASNVPDQVLTPQLDHSDNR